MMYNTAERFLRSLEKKSSDVRECMIVRKFIKRLALADTLRLCYTAGDDSQTAARMLCSGIDACGIECVTAGFDLSKRYLSDLIYINGRPLTPRDFADTLGEVRAISARVAEETDAEQGDRAAHAVFRVGAPISQNAFFAMLVFYTVKKQNARSAVIDVSRIGASLVRALPVPSVWLMGRIDGSGGANMLATVGAGVEALVMAPQTGHYPMQANRICATSGIRFITVSKDHIKNEKRTANGYSFEYRDAAVSVRSLAYSLIGVAAAAAETALLLFPGASTLDMIAAGISRAEPDGRGHMLSSFPNIVYMSDGDEATASSYGVTADIAKLFDGGGRLFLITDRNVSESEKYTESLAKLAEEGIRCVSLCTVGQGGRARLAERLSEMNARICDLPLDKALEMFLADSEADPTVKERSNWLVLLGGGELSGARRTLDELIRKI